jgi:diguanylate cyclase (GGDEF)-like protein
MKEVESKTIPTDVYLSFVSSLFGNRGTLWTGVVVHVVWCLIVFNSTDDAFYLAMAAAFMAVCIYRVISFRAFDRADKSTLTEVDIRAIERRYIIGGALTAALLGICSGYALVVLQNTFAAFTCIAMTLGSMMSIVGRNYGSKSAVDAQTIGACFPIIAASLMSGERNLILMSLLLVPFGLTTRSMAKGVREFLYENVTASREMSIIAGRFDTALTTMAHGLVMLDGDGRIQVINRRARSLLGLKRQRDLKDEPFVEALRDDAQNVPAKALPQLSSLADGSLGRALLQFQDDRRLEFSATRRADSGVVLIFEDVTARVEAEEKVRHMAEFDGLTGLPNRSHFGNLAQDMLAGARDRMAGLAVLDVDGFKHVNDMRGHIVGDRLLAAIAGRLAEMGSADALIGRLVGDEFVVMLGNGETAEDIEKRVRHMHATLQGYYGVDDIRLSVSLNSGCVILPAADFAMEDWQIKADLALNHAKSAGNGTLIVFREEMDAQYTENQQLRSDLRQAIEARDFHTVYQPMYRPDGSGIECCEALIRWRHPERGMVGPNIFVPLAEDMGLVTQITHFVLEQACQDCAKWPEHVAVSVNLSIEDLRDQDIIEHVVGALQRHALHPSRLHLEVTESCFMDEPVAVSAILNQFRAIGITIAIDDFGTGFSSLSYLDTLPLDAVKIDRAFIRELGEDQRKLKLLRGIVNLSRELGLHIVVEGVETREQLSLINRHNLADLVQGYVFSMPVSSDRILGLFGEGNAADKAPGLRRSDKRAESPILRAAAR